MDKKKKKKILISSVAGVLAAAIAGGTWLGLQHRGGDPVFVYEFMNVGMTEYWGDKQESYGPVSSDNIQTVFLTDTQEITEVLVKEGDMVKEGDLLMTFDTTLSAMDLERKRLEVEKKRLQLEEEKQELQKIKNMKPMQLPPQTAPEEEEKPDLGQELTAPSGYLIYPEKDGQGNYRQHDGSSPEKAMVLWLRNDRYLTADVLQTVFAYSQELQIPLPGENAADPTGETRDSSKPSSLPPSRPSSLPEGDQSQPENGNSQPENGGDSGIFPEVPGGPDQSGDQLDPQGPPEDSGDPRPEQPPLELKARVKAEYGIDVKTLPGLLADNLLDPQGRELMLSRGFTVLILDEQTVDGVDWARILFRLDGSTLEGWVLRDALALEGEPGYEPPREEPSRPEDSGESQLPVAPPENPMENLPPILDPDISMPELDLPGEGGDTCFLVVKVTDQNRLLGSPVTWQGLEIRGDGSFRFFPAAGIPDYTLVLPDPEEDTVPDFDMGSGMTAAQIAKLRQEQEKKIQEAEFDLRMAEADYKIKKRELDDGNIYAQFDGKVVSLMDEQEARSRKKPFMKVSGGGGFYVEGTLGELEREAVEIGQEVTVNDWNTGEMYTGKIVSIGDFPVNQGYRGRGNPNSSQYPFRAFVDGEANLQAGSYVSIQYTAGGGENGIYLENPFLRTEKGRSYVYVMGENNRLEKRFVTTGKSLWGSYTEIRSGLTEEDLIAFPYGKNVKPGAKAQLGDMSDLYGGR